MEAYGGFTPFKTQNSGLNGLGFIYKGETISDSDFKDLIAAGYTVDPSLIGGGGAAQGFDITKPPMWLLGLAVGLVALAVLRKK